MRGRSRIREQHAKRTFLPISSALALAACAQPTPEIAEQGGQAIECAVDGAVEYANVCRLVEIAVPNDPYFIVRHPDGGFRKLALEENPSGFTAGDGAERARSWREGEYAVLEIGTDRYRWREPTVE